MAAKLQCIELNCSVSFDHLVCCLESHVLDFEFESEVWLWVETCSSAPLSLDFITADLNLKLFKVSEQTGGRAKVAIHLVLLIIEQMVLPAPDPAIMMEAVNRLGTLTFFLPSQTAQFP